MTIKPDLQAYINDAFRDYRNRTLDDVWEAFDCVLEDQPTIRDPEALDLIDASRRAIIELRDDRPEDPRRTRRYFCLNCSRFTSLNATPRGFYCSHCGKGVFE
jgi:hypothetical protein